MPGAGLTASYRQDDVDEEVGADAEPGSDGCGQCMPLSVRQSQIEERDERLQRQDRLREPRCPHPSTTRTPDRRPAKQSRLSLGSIPCVPHQKQHSPNGGSNIPRAQRNTWNPWCFFGRRSTFFGNLVCSEFMMTDLPSVTGFHNRICG